MKSMIVMVYFAYLFGLCIISEVPIPRGMPAPRAKHVMSEHHPHTTTIAFLGHTGAYTKPQRQYVLRMIPRFCVIP